MYIITGDLLWSFGHLKIIDLILMRSVILKLARRDAQNFVIYVIISKEFSISRLNTGHKGVVVHGYD